ncbi:MAG: M48 family metallopeptidase [Burkholderiales bacterium]|jgi:predicted Zn-dependent protease|nr:M48 family metallopeptidase [Burkholderiales bacterium]MCA3216182.1 M48 family metallopeptidase [Burkholderiales bacterium]MCA3225717.1 M48 family metallopeptidase [Burkholderiales bacterium]MCE2644675.1 M48 family metallopeptidase [Burkholderiaceae bacterium]
MTFQVRRRLLWGAFLGALTITGCQTVQTTRGGVVGVDRPQQMSPLTPSAAQVDAAARQQYLQVLNQAQQKGALNRDPRQTERVRAIAQRLIPHTAVFRDDAVRWNWEVNVLVSDQVNAWCMPGGKIAVYTGLIEKLRVTDDELAAVMGHEIAHALREHARERMGRAQAAGLGVLAAEILTGVRLGDAGNTLAQAMFVLPNSRDNEQEADRIGVELAARASYDPRAAITLWQKMGAASGGGAPPQWLSTHPSNETRIRDLQDYAQRVMPLFEQARARR